MSSLDNMGNLDDPGIWKNRGNDFFNKGQFEEAIKCYFKAIELNPEYIDAWNNLGFTYLKMGKIEEADKCNKKVKEIKLKLSNIEERQIPQKKNENRKRTYPLLIIFSILVIVIAIVAASVFGVFNGGDTSKTTTSKEMAISPQIDPIVGVWIEDVTTLDDTSPIIYKYIFQENGKYRWEDQKSSFEGKWEQIKENQYIVTYSFTEESDIYNYDPTTDTLHDTSYPSLTIYREGKMPSTTLFPTSIQTTTAPLSSNLYNVGDEIQRSTTDSAYDKDRAWVILKVDYDEEKYSIGKLYYDPDVRQWYKVNDDLPEIRFFNAVERDYPNLVGSINWNTVPIKYTIKTCDGNSILSYDSKQPECDTGKNVVSGYGDDVIKLDVKTADLLVLSISHNGRSNFAIILKDSEGNWVDLLVNTIGPYNGRKTVKVDVGTYWFDITADGAWAIKFST